MVVIPVGTFQMGSEATGFLGRNKPAYDETPRHQVSIQPFLLGKYEVTQEEWFAVMGNNPSYFQKCGSRCPVEQVSWDDAQEFSKRLSQKTGKQYRLPSEAEWEYAARAGSNSNWSFGDDVNTLSEYAWYTTNSNDRTQPVGGKKPNAFGMFDVHGNVLEWTQDCWSYSYSGAPKDGSALTSGLCSGRVMRGGSWLIYPEDLRSAFRKWNSTEYRKSFVGVRIARSL